MWEVGRWKREDGSDNASRFPLHASPGYETQIEELFYSMGMVGKSYIKTITIVAISLLFIGCPREDCDQNLKVATIPNLATIEPLQTVYGVGDKINSLLLFLLRLKVLRIQERR